MTEPAALSEDQQAVARRHLQDALLSCQTLMEAVSRTGQVPEVAASALAVAEFRLADVARLFGVETDGVAKQEERYAALRRANGRVRELEELLGQGASAQQTAAALKTLAKRLNQWWDQEGFGHISEMRFTDGGHLDVTFSCHLFGAFRLLDSPTPVSDKQRRAQWLQSLSERGYDVVDDEGSRDMELLDTDASRAVLLQLFAKHLPSSRVIAFTNHSNRKGAFTMRDVRLYIYDLEDVAALAVCEPAQAPA